MWRAPRGGGRRQASSPAAGGWGLTVEAWLRVSAASPGGLGLALLSSVGVFPGSFRGCGPSRIRQPGRETVSGVEMLVRVHGRRGSSLEPGEQRPRPPPLRPRGIRHSCPAAHSGWDVAA